MHNLYNKSWSVICNMTKIKTGMLYLPYKYYCCVLVHLQRQAVEDSTLSYVTFFSRLKWKIKCHKNTTLLELHNLDTVLMQAAIRNYISIVIIASWHYKKTLKNE